MEDKDLAELLDLLYTYFVKRLNSDGILKNYIKSVNAVVTDIGEKSENIGENIGIKFPYDEEVIYVPNKSTTNLSEGNLVCVHYNIDLKNAYIAYKV